MQGAGVVRKIATDGAREYTDMETVPTEEFVLVRREDMEQILTIIKRLECQLDTSRRAS